MENIYSITVVKSIHGESYHYYNDMKHQWHGKYSINSAKQGHWNYDRLIGYCLAFNVQQIYIEKVGIFGERILLNTLK